MAELIKRLGSASLPSSTDTVIYTVPASTSAVINITICNIGSVDIQYRIARTIGGSTSPSNEDYIMYNTPITPGQTHQCTGLSMGANEVIIGYADDTGLTIIIDGVEIT